MEGSEEQELQRIFESSSIEELGSQHINISDSNNIYISKLGEQSLRINKKDIVDCDLVIFESWSTAERLSKEINYLKYNNISTFDYQYLDEIKGGFGIRNQIGRSEQSSYLRSFLNITYPIILFLFILTYALHIIYYPLSNRNSKIAEFLYNNQAEITLAILFSGLTYWSALKYTSNQNFRKSKKIRRTYNDAQSSLHSLTSYLASLDNDATH